MDKRVKYLLTLLVILAVKCLFLTTVIRWPISVFLKVVFIIVFDSVSYTMTKRIIDNENER